MLVQKYWTPERLLQKKTVFVNLYISPFFATSQPTLGHYRVDSLTHLMLIIAFLQFQPKAHGEPCNKLGPLRTNRASSSAWTGNLATPISTPWPIRSLSVHYFAFINWPDWLTSAICQMVNLIGCVTLWIIFQSFLSFFVWGQNKQRRWFFG